MTDEQDFDKLTADIEARYHAEKTPHSPPPALDADILAIAEQEAKKTRKRHDAITPFSHGRMAQFSIAASVVLAVSIVIIMQDETPEEFSLEEQITAQTLPTKQLKRQVETAKIEKKHDLDMAQKLEKEITASPSAAIEADSDSVMQDRVASFAAPEPLAQAAPEATQRLAPSAPARKRAPASMEKRVAEAPVATRSHRYQTPLSLSGAGDLDSKERDFMRNVNEQLSANAAGFTALWQPHLQKQIKQKLDSENNWQRYSDMLRRAKIIGTIRHQNKTIFVLNTNKQDLFNQQGSLSIIWLTEGEFRLTLLDTGNRKLLNLVQRMQTQN